VGHARVTADHIVATIENAMRLGSALDVMDLAATRGGASRIYEPHPQPCSNLLVGLGVLRILRGRDKSPTRKRF